MSETKLALANRKKEVVCVLFSFSE